MIEKWIELNKELIKHLYFKEENEYNSEKIVELYSRYYFVKNILKDVSENLKDQTNEYNKYITTMGSFINNLKIL